MTPYEELVTFAHTLADTAATTVLPYFRSGLHVDVKGTGERFDPVTEGDRAVELAIREAIQAHYPDHAILGEEHGAKSGNSPYRWVIDPIDGTRAFIIGMPSWGTLIGLEIDEKPTIGLMSQPFTNDRFWSDGERSFMRGGDGVTREIQTRKGTNLAEAQVACTTPDMFARQDELSAFNALVATTKTCRHGTDCFGFALLAAGWIDIVVEAGLQPYDIVALIPIIENAGGVVTTWDGGDARHGGRIIAAADTKLHAEAMAILQRHF